MCGNPIHLQPPSLYLPAFLHARTSALTLITSLLTSSPPDEVSLQAPPGQPQGIRKPRATVWQDEQEHGRCHLIHLSPSPAIASASTSALQGLHETYVHQLSNLIPEMWQMTSCERSTTLGLKSICVFESCNAEEPYDSLQ